VNVTTYVATANYHKLPLADPRPTVGASVQRSQPSVGQYVLRLLLDHNARCHRHWESWPREVERDPSYSKRICRKKYPRLWDNLLRSCSCPVICLCSPTGVSADSPVPSGVHALNWTAVEWISWEPPLKKKFVLVLVNLRRDWTRKGRISDVMRKVCWFKRSGEGGGCVNSSGTNQICCQCHLFCLFPVKVCPWYKTQKKNHKKTGKPAGAWYVHKLSVPGIQFRFAPVLLMAFSGHRTMMYTLEVGFTIFSNLM